MNAGLPLSRKGAGAFYDVSYPPGNCRASKQPCVFFRKLTMPNTQPKLRLRTLHVRRFESYERRGDGYEAKMTWHDGSDEITVTLDPQMSVALLEFAAPLLTKFAAASARQMENSIIGALEEARAPQITLENGEGQ